MKKKMNNTELPLVTHEQAKKLKAAGFDWETHKGYDERGLKINLWVEEFGMKIPHTKAPEVALALKWMRDVKEIKFAVGYDVLNGGYRWWCFDVKNNDTDPPYTYEAAETALLDELLALLENGK